MSEEVPAHGDEAAVPKEDEGTQKKADAHKKKQTKKKTSEIKNESEETPANEEEEEKGGDGEGKETPKPKNEDEGEGEEEPPKKVPSLVKQRTLLVIGGKSSINWAELFRGATLHAGLVEVRVETASWEGKPTPDTSPQESDFQTTTMKRDGEEMVAILRRTSLHENDDEQLVQIITLTACMSCAHRYRNGVLQ